MPNLFSALPVVILAWVWASTSGLTRSATRRALAPVPRHAVEQLQLRQRFDVELLDAGLERRRSSRRRLADAGEDDALRRDAGRQRAAQLALRDDIGAGAEPREGARSPPGWNWPSASSRWCARAPAKAADEGRDSARSGRPWNSNRTACRRPRRAGRAARLRHEACRPDMENGSLIHGLVGVRMVLGGNVGAVAGAGAAPPASPAARRRRDIDAGSASGVGGSGAPLSPQAAGRARTAAAGRQPEAHGVRRSSAWRSWPAAPAPRRRRAAHSPARCRRSWCGSRPRPRP